MHPTQFVNLFKNAYQEYNRAKNCPYEWIKCLTKSLGLEDITKDSVIGLKKAFAVKMVLGHYATDVSVKLLNLYDIVAKEANLYHPDEEKEDRHRVKL
jgi:hypothetical protein